MPIEIQPQMLDLAPINRKINQKGVQVIMQPMVTVIITDKRLTQHTSRTTGLKIILSQIRKAILQIQTTTHLGIALLNQKRKNHLLVKDLDFQDQVKLQEVQVQLVIHPQDQEPKDSISFAQGCVTI